MQQTVGGEAEALRSLYLAVSQFGQSFDPNSVSGAEAKKVLELASRTVSVLEVIKSLALLRIDETEAYRSSGHHSAADYGAAKSGTSRTNAKRAMRTARKAKRLPKTDEAMRKGDISAEQADAIADAASANPEAEADLLRSAKTDDLGTLRKKAKQAKFSADPNNEARNRRIHAKRSLRSWTDDEGAFHAHLCTTPEAGGRFLAALKPFQDAVFAQARKDGRREAPDAYAADALDTMARNATPPPRPKSAADGGSPPQKTPPPANEPDADRGGDNADNKTDRPSDDPSGSPPGSPPGDAPPGDPPDRSPACTCPNSPTRSSPRATVHLNIDFAPLLRGHLEPGDICEIPGVGPVSLSAAQALLGDATIDLIIKKGDDIRSVVHYGRTVTAAQRRALEARDPCCIRPGCGRTHNLEIDHRDGWAITHETSIDQLSRLCPYEHDLKTHHGHTYSGGPGHWKWHTPNDPPPDHHGGDDLIDLRNAQAAEQADKQADLFGEAG